MTYCVGIRLNAGLDAISTFRKMMIYEKPGDRFMVMLSAGNLSISQAVREVLEVEKIDNGAVGEGREPITIWNATSMFDATRVLGAAVRRVYATDGPALKAAGLADPCRQGARVRRAAGREPHARCTREAVLPSLLKKKLQT